jgi:non-ribosomal peptide synthetase-like protein
VKKAIDGLTADLGESPTAENGYAGPTTGTEKILAEVLADVAHVDPVSVDSNFFLDLGADSMVMAQFCARVRKRADLPSVSMKDIYEYPTLRSLAASIAAAAPLPASADAAAVPVETILAEVMADLLHVDHVSADSNFFDDLGADSMVMAQFCARVRKRTDLPTVSMQEVYQHPTTRSLATALAAGAPAVPVARSVELPHEPPRRASTRQYVVCGTLQLLTFLGYAYLTALVGIRGYAWISAGSGIVDVYLRSTAYAAVAFLVLSTLPILAKWVLIGRWKQQQIPIWSLAYFRFWLVKTLVRSDPLVLFVGSPLYVLYLRALGAKIGKGVLILSRSVPICTDLVTIGDGTVIRKDSFFSGYRANAGVIETGSLTLGKDVLVGETTVFDIDTSMGDGAQLGHTSSLHAGQSVPSGQAWHGSPAQPTTASYRTVEGAPISALRPALYGLSQLLTMVFVYLPLALGGVAALMTVPEVNALVGPAPLDFSSGALYVEALAVSALLLFGSILGGLLLTFTVPRVLNLAIKPDKVYPLYGFHDSLHRTVARLTNSKFLTALFGDSSFIVPYLRALGYKLSPVVQTGSNFGSEVKHDIPYLSSVGTGSVMASGLSIINADYSSTSFRVSRTSIGANCFFGNDLAYPPQSRVGDNCLLATKVMVPIDGEIREGVGLLGSPSFEIPRSVERDHKFAHLMTEDVLPRRLAAKNRHNAVTVGYFLLVRWLLAFVITMIGAYAFDIYPTVGVSALAVATILVLVVNVVVGVVVERASTGFRGLKPKYCSIYDKDFWRTERFFKLEAGAGGLFNGTPFKSLIWRMVGVRVGKRLFDDGGQMAEKNLVTIGDDVTINEGTWIQCHSQEDYAFKSDRITIGSGCTLGVRVEMLYSVTIGDGAVILLDSFLMKGEEVPPYERWGGNPAREMPGGVAALPAGVGSGRAGAAGRHRAARTTRRRSPVRQRSLRHRPGQRQITTWQR